jgi:hypothetical protein
MSYVGRKSGRAALISADIPSNLNLLGDYVKIPSATTTERDALTPVVGMMLYNTTLGIMQQYAASGWASIDSPPTISSLNYPGDDTALDTVGEFNDATCDYNNDPTITHDTNSNMKVGMSVSGTGIPVGATIASVTSTTAFELSASTTGGAVTNGTLTFNTQTLIITGTNFATGATVTIDGTAPSTVTRDSSTQITVTGTPAKTAGTKVDGLIVSNSSGLSASINVDYSALPAWTTASGNLGTLYIGGSAISTIDLAATSATSYALTNLLPPGLAMSTSTGDITGTITGTTYTTYNFTVTATDAETQSSPRLFNIITANPEPIGGTITTYSGYRVHTFLTSGTFTVRDSRNVSILIVGAGGGGGYQRGGGGGAGGFNVVASHAVTAQTYTITVGTGGAGGTGNGTTASNGGLSQFGSITASSGGGGGGSAGNASGASVTGGGSGGGGGADTGGGGTGTYNGGAGFSGSTTTAAGGGGGGSAGHGTAGASGNGGDAGAGTDNLYRTGSNVTYAAGAVGSQYNIDYAAGGANTGDGGGCPAAAVDGFVGGSGIVVIRYAV